MMSLYIGVAASVIGTALCYGIAYLWRANKRAERGKAFFWAAWEVRIGGRLGTPPSPPPALSADEALTRDRLPNPDEHHSER